MKLTATTVMILAAGSIAEGGAINPAEERIVEVCMSPRTADFGVGLQAQDLASKMFAGIGVTVKWNSPTRCPARAIQIVMGLETPRTLKPGALAYAFPYEGIHIRVFYDRIRALYDPKLLPNLLAHVLVHEITHILQAIIRHSDEGLMKAHWGQKDLARMACESLPFADKDVDLIYRGLADRTAHATVALNASSRTARPQGDAQ
jgi:hypothetical protein